MAWNWPIGPAELLADLGVLRRGVGGPAGDADALGGQQGRHQGAGERAAQVGQHAVVADLDGVGPDVRDRAQRVDAGYGFDLDLIGVEDEPLLAAVDRDGQHQDRRLRRGGDGAHLATDDEAPIRPALPGGGQAGVDGVRGDRVTGGQRFEALVVGVVGGDQRAGDRRRDERPGHRAVAELGEHDRQLEDAEALSADGFRTGERPAGPARQRPSSRAAGWDRGLERLVQNLRRRDPR